MESETLAISESEPPLENGGNTITSGGSTTSGGSQGAEKIVIEAIDASSAPTIVLLCKALSGGEIIVTNAILKDGSGETVEILTITAVTLPADGMLTPVSFGFTATMAGYHYSVALVSQAGGQFLSSPFEA